MWIQKRYTHAYCRCIKSSISEDHWWSVDGVLWDSCPWDSWSRWAYEIEPPKQDVFGEQITSDSDILELIRVIKSGWPETKKCPPAVQPYYDERSELIESQGLVFRGEQLVVPLSLWKDMLSQLHSIYIGIGGCVHHAREILYWPRLSAEIRDFVSHCTTCQMYRQAQAHEDLQPREHPSRPWQKINLHQVCCWPSWEVDTGPPRCEGKAESSPASSKGCLRQGC